MGRRADRLTVKQVENMREPGRYADGDGLYLQVRASAGVGVTKSWLFRYMVDGRAYEMGLGPAPKVVTLAEARSLALDAKRQLNAGINPLEHRRAQEAAAKLAAATAKTFRDFADDYVRSQRVGWKNEKHADQWASTLATYCYPKIGSLPIAKIDTGLVLSVLEQPVNVGDERRPRFEPFWTAKAETASRLRGRIEKILDAAKVRKLRDGENPARWRGHLDHVLLNRPRAERIEHHAALPFDNAPAFVKELREETGIGARALEFLILTTARTGEVIGAPWGEIVGDVWTVPGARMKGKREHRVPLVDRAIEILEEMRALRGDDVRDRDPIFPGRDPFNGLSNMALLKTLERMNRGNITTHGFRSTFRDWASERTNFSREVIEMALAHAIGDKVEAAYRRGDLFEKRRELMKTWAQFLEKPAATVHSIHAKRERRVAEGAA